MKTRSRAGAPLLRTGTDGSFKRSCEIEPGHLSPRASACAEEKEAFAHNAGAFQRMKKRTRLCARRSFDFHVGEVDGVEYRNVSRGVKVT